jgi:hypothetical protein
LQSLKAEKEEMNKLALELSKNQGKYIVDLT